MVVPSPSFLAKLRGSASPKNRWRMFLVLSSFAELRAARKHQFFFSRCLFLDLHDGIRQNGGTACNRRFYASSFHLDLHFNSL